VPLAREAFDPVHLQQDREGAHLPDAGDREQSLDVGVGHQVGVEALLEPPHVLPEKLPLLPVTGGLELGHGRQVCDAPNVVLLEEPVNAVAGPDLFLDQAEPGPHHVAERPELNGDHMGLRECCNAGSIGPDLLMFAMPFVIGGALLLFGVGLAIVRAVRAGSRSR